MNDNSTQREQQLHEWNDSCSVQVNGTTCKGNNNHTKGTTIVYSQMNDYDDV
jgi:hypothetical protein